MLLAPFHVRKPGLEALEVLFLITSYLVIVFVLPVTLSAVVSYRALTVGTSCPHCRGATIPLLHRPLAALTRLRLVRAQRRWCLDCGWEGFVRVSRQRPALRVSHERATHTLDLRSLTVDGRPWRVMLQYWHHTGLFYGRLVFMAPTGRLWLDAKEAFTGESQNEVLGQAMAMPDGLLMSRLRRLVS